MSDKTPPVTWASLPRKDQLCLLLMIRFSESAVRISISAYIYYQLQSLDPSVSSAELIKQCAYLQTAYTIAQCISSPFWGLISDSRHGGRKILVLISLLGSLISCSLFGFISSFRQAVILRALEGLTNGTVAMVRTMVAEVVKEKRFQAQAFALLPIATGIATIVSPLVAGWTVQLESGNRDSSFLKRYPYALPALLNAVFLFLLLLASFLFLEETHEPLLRRFDPGLAISRKIRSLLRANSSAKPTSAGYLPVKSEDREEDEMVPMNGLGGDSDSGVPASPLEPGKNDARLPTRRIFTRNVLLMLLANLISEFHLNSTAVATPLLLVDRVSSIEAEHSRSLPFRFGGGAGFTPRSLAWYSAVFGIVGLPMQLLVYPYFAQRLGTLKLWRRVYLGFPLLYLAYPYIVVMPSSTPPPSEKTGVIVWAYLLLIQTSTSFIASHIIPSQLVLTNSSSPHPSALGRTHSINFFMAMAIRATSSALAGQMFAFGSTHNMSGIVFWINSVVSCGGVVLTRFVVEGKQ